MPVDLLFTAHRSATCISVRFASRVRRVSVPGNQRKNERRACLTALCERWFRNPSPALFEKRRTTGGRRLFRIFRNSVFPVFRPLRFGLAGLGRLRGIRTGKVESRTRGARGWTHQDRASSRARIVVTRDQLFFARDQLPSMRGQNACTRRAANRTARQTGASSRGRVARVSALIRLRLDRFACEESSRSRQ